MSGTKLTFTLLLSMIFGMCFALSWHADSYLPYPVNNDPVDFIMHPGSFPDTLCIASSWSPVYAGFGIYEGMIYGGTSKFDLSVKSQYHRLMSNYQMSAGFPLLKNQDLQAGLQFHYTMSLLHGDVAMHRLSCSGGLVLTPDPRLTISALSHHMLGFPADSCIRILQPDFQTTAIFHATSFLNLSIGAKKAGSMPWRLYLGARVSYRDVIWGAIQYECSEHCLSLQISLCPGSWVCRFRAGFHRILGFTQDYVIAYVR